MINIQHCYKHRYRQTHADKSTHRATLQTYVYTQTHAVKYMYRMALQTYIYRQTQADRTTLQTSRHDI